MAKIEFPKFSGDDVKGWVFRCEQFFLLEQTLEIDKLTLTSIYFHDKALLWHSQFIGVHGVNVSWEVYKQAILARFGNVYDETMSELKFLKNENTVKEYEDAFDSLLSRVEVSEEHVVSLFISGLRTKIEMGGRSAFVPNNSRYSNASTSTFLKPLLTTPNTPSNNVTVKPNTLVAVQNKRLSQKEYAEKRANNLCFYCDQNYVLGHKCSGQLYSLVLMPEMESEWELLEEDETVVDSGLVDLQAPLISLNALTRANNFKTMRVIGTNSKNTIHILIDCGSTHNFLDKNMANSWVVTLEEHVHWQSQLLMAIVWTHKWFQSHHEGLYTRLKHRSNPFIPPNQIIMSANDNFSLHDDEELSLHDDASLDGSVPATNKGDAPAKPP
ncbi:putative mitochondrial protein [Tanacetum coccineum]